VVLPPGDEAQPPATAQRRDHVLLRATWMRRAVPGAVPGGGLMSMEPITEEFLGGRLKKITDVVYITNGLFDEYHPGRHTWLLDGNEITEEAAQTLLAGQSDT
jgi:hypothetical protein